MCIVSINDFNNDPRKYFQIAQLEIVTIVDGDQTYELLQKDAFISADELIRRVHHHIDEIFAKD